PPSEHAAARRRADRGRALPRHPVGAGLHPARRPYGAYIAPSAANANVSAAVETIDKGKQFETGWGFAGLFVQPLWLQWTLWRLDLTAVYGFYAPTGRFSVGATDNIGLGFWTQQWQTASAFNFDEARTFSLIMVQTWEYNSKMSGMDLRPGS